MTIRINLFRKQKNLEILVSSIIWRYLTNFENHYLTVSSISIRSKCSCIGTRLGEQSPAPFLNWTERNTDNVTVEYYFRLGSGNWLQQSTIHLSSYFLFTSLSPSLSVLIIQNHIYSIVCFISMSQVFLQNKVDLRSSCSSFPKISRFL